MKLNFSIVQLAAATCRLVPIALFVLVAISSPSFGQFDRGWEFVVPDATLVAGIDWQSVSGSEFGRTLKQQFGPGMKSSSGNLDFVRRFDYAIMSATDSGGRGRRPANSVVFLSGLFDLARLRRSALTDGGRTQQYASVELLSKPGSGGPVVAVLGEDSLVLGDEAAVKAALRNRSSRRPLPSIASAAAEVGQGAGVWLIAEGLANATTEAAGPFRGLSKLALTIHFTQNADLALTMQAPDPKRAASLSAGLAMLSAMLPPGAAQPQVQSTGSSVRMRLSVTPDQIKAGAHQLAAALSQQMGVPDSLKSILGEAAQSPVQQPKPVQRASPEQQSKPPEKQVIRIHGMEGGVREIPIEEIK